jgi:hypothetical protein
VRQAIKLRESLPNSGNYVTGFPEYSPLGKRGQLEDTALCTNPTPKRQLVNAILEGWYSQKQLEAT